ncbi:MAG: restriction endonuclease subunit S [Candidatus Methanoperedens sp.]|nr:restriction endonuclease subunit S [Candidatus Methanoperedens sp.]
MNNKPIMQEKSYKETEIGKIPVDWEVSTLDEISLKVTDGSHFSPKESETGNKIIATVKDMGYYHFSFKNCKRIADDDFNLLVKNGCSPEKGDIIISKDGANCLDLIFVYNQDKKIVLLSSIAIVKLKKGFNPQFYRYYLLSPVAQKIMREGYVSGSAIPRVILKDFKKVPIPILPNIEIQNKIADILRSLDDKISLNRSMNSTLEAIGQALFRRWFVDFEFPDGEGKPYRSSGGEMVETELGEVPKGWEVKPFYELIDINPNRKLIKDRHAKKVGMADLNAWQSWIESWQLEEYKSGPRFQNGDTLFARITPSLEHGKTAFVSFLYKDEVAFGSTEFIIFAPKIIQSNLYIFHLARSEYFREAAIGAMTGSSGRQRVPENLFNQLLICLPSQKIIEKFHKVVTPLFEGITINSNQIRNLSKIRDALLPKLISGEIRVFENQKLEGRSST